MRTVGVAAVLAATVVVAAACGSSGSSGAGGETKTGGQGKDLVAADLTGGLLQREDMPSTVKAASQPALDISLQDQAKSSLQEPQPLAKKEAHIVSLEGALTAEEVSDCGSWVTSGWSDLGSLEGMSRVYAEKAFPFASSLVGDTVVAGPKPADLKLVREAVTKCSRLAITLTKYNVTGTMTQQLVTPPQVDADDVIAIRQVATWPKEMPAEAIEQAKLFTGDAVFMVKDTATVIIYTAGPAGVSAFELAPKAFDRAMTVLR